MTATAPRPRRARNAHRCGACDGAIPAGSMHLAQTVFGDGRAWTWRSHYVCDAVVRYALARERRRDEEWARAVERHRKRLHDVVAAHRAALNELQAPTAGALEWGDAVWEDDYIETDPDAVTRIVRALAEGLCKLLRGTI